MFTVKSRSSDIKLEALANRVLAHFGDSLPHLTLLCYFDSEDWLFLKTLVGDANRGLFTPTRKDSLWPQWECWPPYLQQSVMVVDRETKKYACDCLIYLHSSSCAIETGLIMTLAHELQHFCQYGNQREVWAANNLLSNLQIATKMLTPWEFPIEREARIVSKHAAECLCGKESVQQHIDAKIRGAIDQTDVADWKFVQQLATSRYDLFAETVLVFQQLAEYRPELQSILMQHQDNEDFRNLDLNEFY